MLTRKQHDLLLFLFERIKEQGVPPSFEEMKQELNLKSKSGIHRMISALEDRGFIRRLAHKARALEVIKLPENISSGLSNSISSTFLKETAQKDYNLRPASIPGISGNTDIPLVGRIAAGTPIEALQDTNTLITVPQHMLSGNNEHYALEVTGDSMINVGIQSGDIVVIKMAESAQNGEIVVALVEDHEATLKKFQKRGSAIALEAANPNYETMLYDSNQVKIQGILTGLLRTY